MKQNTWISCAKGVEIEIERIRKEEWVLVDIEGIRTTAKHSCNRKVCIGRKNGYDYTVIEAQPCYRYMELDEKYKKAHRYCKKFIHRLPFTPFSQKAINMDNIWIHKVVEQTGYANEAKHLDIMRKWRREEKVKQ